MTTPDAPPRALDHVKNAIALVRLLNAGRSADAETLLSNYVDSNDQAGLTSALAMAATTLAAYVDRLGRDMVAAKPDYPAASSSDVLRFYELTMAKAAGNGAKESGSRGEPISYL